MHEDMTAITSRELPYPYKIVNDKKVDTKEIPSEGKSKVDHNISEYDDESDDDRVNIYIRPNIFDEVMRDIMERTSNLILTESNKIPCKYIQNGSRDHP